MLGSEPEIDLQKMLILAKKIMFSGEAQFDIGGYVQTSTVVAFGAQKTRTHTLKSRCDQNESLFDA